VYSRKQEMSMSERCICCFTRDVSSMLSVKADYCISKINQDKDLTILDFVFAVLMSKLLR
jgi:hypothetical protein